MPIVVGPVMIEVAVSEPAVTVKISAVETGVLIREELDGCRVTRPAAAGV
jgi:hypothetical protein